MIKDKKEMVMMCNATSQFRDEISATGLIPPDVIVPGKMHRFPGIRKRNGNTSGWCKLFDDELGGCFGDWSSGLSENWQIKREKSISRTERLAFKCRVEQARTLAASKRTDKYARTAKKASSIWNSAEPVIFHEYLKHKQVLPMGIRVDQRNNLLIPLTDGKDLHSLQFIQPDGTKRFLKGGKTKSMYYPIRLVEQPEKVLICEGFATAVTLYMESRTPVIAAFYANNLMPVAMAIRERWPEVELIIAGDDDRQTRGNPGASKARDAANASGAALALPQWPKDAPEHLTDFNDLARWLNGGAS